MTDPNWAQFVDPPNKHLPDLLVYASASYGKHLDWFHRHKEGGIKLLAGLLVAEFTIVGLHEKADLREGMRCGGAVPGRFRDDG